MIVNDEYVCKAFDSLGRLNYETKHILNDDKVKEYLLNRFDDSFDIEENARRIKFNIETIPLCPVCGNKCKYIGSKKVYYFCCGDKKCFKKIKYDKSKQTFIKNHNGLTSSFQLPGVKEKSDKTIFDKYGVDNIAKSDIAKEKSKQTCLKKYGVEYSFQSENNKEKSKQTCLKKYGVDNIFKLPEVIKHAQSKCHTYEAKQKQKETCLKKYGVDNYAKTEEFKNKMNWEEQKKKEYETKKKNNSFNKSKPENESYKLLKDKYPNVEYQYRSELYPFACDFYIPELDLYIECNYHWTHGDHPFNENSLEDKEKLEVWKNKNTKFYNNAINTWIIRDVNKRNKAKENNLNYIEFFTILELINWLNNN